MLSISFFIFPNMELRPDPEKKLGSPRSFGVPIWMRGKEEMKGEPRPPKKESRGEVICKNKKSI